MAGDPGHFGSDVEKRGTPQGEKSQGMCMADGL